MYLFIYFYFLYHVLYHNHWLIFSNCLFVCTCSAFHVTTYVCTMLMHPFRLQYLDRHILSCRILFPVYLRTCSVIIALFWNVSYSCYRTLHTLLSFLNFLSRNFLARSVHVLFFLSKWHQDLKVAHCNLMKLCFVIIVMRWQLLYQHICLSTIDSLSCKCPVNSHIFFIYFFGM